MTVLGAIFIPIALICFFWKPWHLLPLLVIASVFEAGSVFNGSIGDFVFGVSPFYFVEICIGLRLLLWILHGKPLLPSRDSRLRGIAVTLLVFLGWCFLSAIVMPHIFAGMPVYAPREHVDEDILQGNLGSLQWSFSNLGQAIYLTLNVAAAMFAIQTSKTRAQAVELSKALRWAVIIVVLVGFSEQVASWAGWSYPYSVIQNNPNNPSDLDATDQSIDGFLRTSSTFAEPMNSGSFLAAVCSGLLAAYLRGRRGLLAIFALMATGTVLLSTTSTTGYLALLLMLCILAICFNPLAKRDFPIQPSFFKGWSVLTFTVSCIVALALVIPSLSQAVIAMTVEKSETSSFLTRVIADVDAVLICKNTYGLGVGLGSSRHSSLIATLLSTIGIIGTTLFLVVLYRIIKLFPGKWAPATVQMSFWSLIGLLVAQSIGVPDINRPALWGLLMVVIVQLNIWRGTHKAEIPLVGHA